MGDVSLVQLLLDREDTEPNHVEVNHCSALMIACMHGYVEVSTESSRVFVCPWVKKVLE